jgi:hypothetical protein
MGMPGTFDQTDYAFYQEGTESGSTIIGTQNNQQTIDVDTNFQIRILLQETSGTADVFESLQWEYNLAAAGWNNVTTSSSVLQAVNSTSLTDGGDTTSRLTGGGGTFITPNAWVTEDGNSANLSFPGNDHCEALLSCQIIGADVSDGQELLVRVGGTPLPTYTNTADIDINKATTRRIFVVS